MEKLTSPLTQDAVKIWVKSHIDFSLAQNHASVEEIVKHSQASIDVAVSELNAQEKERALKLIGIFIGELLPKPKENANTKTSTAVKIDHSESGMVAIVGNMVIVLSIICAIAGIFFLGKTEVDAGIYYSDTRTEWSLAVIFACIATGISGCVFGYLIKKLGSVLRHLEVLNSQKPDFR